jgi:hypothetical protein
MKEREARALIINEKNSQYWYLLTESHHHPSQNIEVCQYAGFEDDWHLHFRGT